MIVFEAQEAVTPDDAEPAEVRLVEPSLLPAYWSLPVADVG